MVYPGGPPKVGAIWICSLPGGAEFCVALEGEADWASMNGRAALHKSAIKTAIPAMWGVSLYKAMSVLSSNTEMG
jgi:hypothetical protein